MLNEVCQELRNWFDRGQLKKYGEFEISAGKITDTDFNDAIRDNQYFRITGSVFNDGVHKYTSQLRLIDEAFTGSIWLMAVPQDVISITEDATAWVAKYGEQAASPYSSESFGGYSYTKAGNTNGAGNSATWQQTFASRLNRWRKI